MENLLSPCVYGLLPCCMTTFLTAELLNPSLALRLLSTIELILVCFFIELWATNFCLLLITLAIEVTPVITEFYLTWLCLVELALPENSSMYSKSALPLF